MPEENDASQQAPQPEKQPSISELLELPWMGVRPDLVLKKGPVDPDGERTWVLEDPVSGDFFRLGVVEKELFIRLVKEGTPEQAVARLFAETSYRPQAQYIVNFLKMLQTEGLTHLPTQHKVEESQKPKPGRPEDQPLMQRILHGYVYFRLPVLRPDLFLTKMFPRVKWLWAVPMRYFYLICGLMGLFLMMQQFDSYVNSVSHLFTPKGAIAFFLCLALIKIFHEFAHAFTAKSLGLHVRSMGIVFIVLWPILYTDTTDAWKLDDRRKRFLIDIAGMTFEFILAGFALLFWAVLPEGALKSLMFFMSSSSLASSLLVNVNPFMRFDGYYVLMDLWGIDNLQPRAFALMKDAIRRKVVDWQGPVPEYHPQRRMMILYAVGASIYRLFIAVVIAFAVYHLFFKALGIVLLIIELWFFVLRPVWREVKYVWDNRQLFGRRSRLIRSGVVAGSILVLLSIPLPTIEIIPGLVVLEDTTKVNAPTSAMVASELPPRGTVVQKGETVLPLRNDTLLHDIQNTIYDIKITDAKLGGLSAGGEEGGYRNWLAAERKRLVSALEKHRESHLQLEVTSPSDGKLVDINSDLYAGAWVSRDTFLFAVANSDRRLVKGYVHEHNLQRISRAGVVNAEIHVPDLETAVIEATLVEQKIFPVEEFPNEALYDFAKGPVVSQRTENKVKPRSAYFEFTFELSENPTHLAHGTVCNVWLRGSYRSILSRWTRSFFAWFTQEGYF